MNMNIEMAQQAKRDLNDARCRYNKAMVECLPVGTPIRFSMGDRKCDGTIVEPHNGAGFVKVQNNKTQRAYWLALYHIEGLA